MSFGRTLGIGAGSETCRLTTLKQREIVAVGTPFSLFVSLDLQERVQRILLVLVDVETLPPLHLFIVS